MKKLTTVCLCLLLVAALATTAFAATGFSVKASSSSLSRGDSVTLTFSVSSSSEATSYGLMLSYDSSVFELVSGSCNVSGALVSSFSNGFAFMFQTPTAYSGTVGTVVLKVKDNAALGSYKVSGSASVRNGNDAVSASGCSVTLNVSCDHKYSGWTDAGNGKHSRTCSVCNTVQTENHTWNSGEVIKPATCKEAGSKRFTCTACKATKTEETPKTTTHSYGSWTKVDGTNHKRTCSVCSTVQTEKHTWDSGKETTKPTCKKEGVKTFTCTGCKTTKTETVPKSTTHTYTNGCDPECNICGATRTVSHKYSTKWSKNSSTHWHECTVCKAKKDEAKHTPGPEATEKKAQTCTTCGYVIKAALDHKHSYSKNWTSDETGHWHACSGCDEKGDFVAHDFENACDPDCSICAYTRDADHAFAEQWEQDGDKHWHVCTGCGLKQDEDVHVPGEEATETTAQICMICGCELVPALAAKATEPVADQPIITIGEASAKAAPNMIVLMAISVVVVFANAGIITLIINKVKGKKK